MNKNKLVFVFILIIVLISVDVIAQKLKPGETVTGAISFSRKITQLI